MTYDCPTCGHPIDAQTRIAELERELAIAKGIGRSDHEALRLASHTIVALKAEVRALKGRA